MTRHPTRSTGARLPKLATLYPQASRDRSRQDAATHPIDLALRRSIGYRYVLANSGLRVLQEQRETHDAHTHANVPFDQRLDREWTSWSTG